MTTYAAPIVDMPTAASLGLLTNASSVSVFGYSPNLTTAQIGTGINLYEGKTRIPFLTAAIAMQIASTSATDTIAAGTGAQLVLVLGIDNNWDQVAQVIAMSGTTQVAVPTNLLAVNFLIVVSSGTGNTNTGGITLRAVAGAVTYGFIAAANGISHHGLYTIARGYKFIAYNVFINGNQTAGATTTFSTEFLTTDSSGTKLKQFPATFLNNTSFPITLPCPLSVPEKTRGELIVVDVSNNGFTVSTGFTGVLIKL